MTDAAKTLGLTAVLVTVVMVDFQKLSYCATTPAIRAVCKKFQRLHKYLLVVGWWEWIDNKVVEQSV